ncbi:MAG: outer membrane beta-barrel protein, partial [Boseongicola sp.]
MDWQNRWRETALPALVMALTVALFASPSFAQQQPATFRAIPAATTDTDASGQNHLRGTTLFGDAAASPSNQLTDFSKSNSTDQNARSDNPDRDPDQRARRDREPFENPPAGHDPRYFQIEIEPLADRRTRQFFEAEPFPHVGWRLGSFILFQEFEIGPAWDSNVLLGRDARGDWRADFLSETRLVSNWTNHALELRMLHDRSNHNKFTQEDDVQQIYELRGRLDITRRTNLEARAAHEIGQESRNSIDATVSSGAPRADVTTDRVNLTLNHRFNRLSVQLRGGHTRTSYEEPTGGTTNDRDFKSRTIALRAQWEFRPTFSV